MNKCEAVIHIHKEHALWNQRQTSEPCGYAGELRVDGQAGIFCLRHAHLRGMGLVDYVQADGTRTTCPAEEIDKVVAAEQWADDSITLTIPFGEMPAKVTVEP